MGTPDFAAASLDAISESPHQVVCVYTQPPRPSGRGQRTTLSAVHKLADKHGIPVRHPTSLKDPAAAADFAALDADIAVVAAYGLILPPAILAAPRLGCINIHASLLPRWRGAAPIQHAILAGDTESGITIMQMDAGLDTGDILTSRALPITNNTTAETLHDALAALGADMITPAMDALAAGSLLPQPQPEDGACYAAKLSRADGALDWNKSADVLERQVRALSPWPGAWFQLGDQRIKLLAAEVIEDTAPESPPGKVLDDTLTIACGSGALRLIEVQRPGKPATTGDAFLRGVTLSTGNILPSSAD